MIDNNEVLNRTLTMIDEIKADFDHYNAHKGLNKGADSIRVSLSMTQTASSEMLFLITFLRTIDQESQLTAELVRHFKFTRSQLQNEEAKFARFVHTTSNFETTLHEMLQMQVFLTNKDSMERVEFNKQLIVEQLLKSEREN